MNEKNTLYNKLTSDFVDQIQMMFGEMMKNIDVDESKSEQIKSQLIMNNKIIGRIEMVSSIGLVSSVSEYVIKGDISEE
jgi:hypothetical protein